ncbi:MAG: hypothetical protein JSV81_00570 [Anaerolineales bacterium]|nr:MAG: hypothetical protein JSV81_00570 [Anaerolineales bacterium]
MNDKRALLKGRKVIALVLVALTLSLTAMPVLARDQESASDSDFQSSSVMAASLVDGDSSPVSPQSASVLPELQPSLGKAE